MTAGVADRSRPQKDSRPVVVFTSPHAAAPSLKQVLDRHAVEHWMYLGESFPELLRLQDGPFRGIARFGLEADLESAAQTLRRPFLDAIADLGSTQPALAWWASELSERNTMVSPLFLRCCYVSLAMSALPRIPGNVCIVSNSGAVLRTLAELGASGGRRVIAHGRWRGVCDDIARAVWVMLRVAVFVPRGWRDKFLAGKKPPAAASSHGDKVSVVLHTFVDDGCFDRSGEFRDRYLGPLAEWLRAQGYTVRTIATIFQTRRRRGQVFAQLRGQADTFLLPEHYLRWTDYLRALPVLIQQLRFRLGRVCIDRLDLTRLFIEARRDARLPSAVMAYYFVRRLIEAGYRVDLLVDTFENMIPEKLMLLGFQRFSRQTKTLGYQHSALPPHLLCLFTTAAEAAYAPLPDLIVCNGQLAYRIMAKEGYPPNRLAVGPALRYGYLHRCSAEPARRGGGNIVLATIPLPFNWACELVWKLIAALGHVEGIQVWLKPHPMHKASDRDSLCMGEPLPPHFQWVEGEMLDLLARADVGIGMATAAILEFVAAGIPVIRVGPTVGLNLDPLGWFDEFGPAIFVPDDIRAGITRLLRLSVPERETLRRRGREFLGALFESVTEQTLAVFLAPLLGASQSVAGDRPLGGHAQEDSSVSLPRASRAR